MFISVSVQGQGYKIRLHIRQMANQQVILANYFDGKTYAVDTVTLDQQGIGAFQKETSLSQGIYALLFSPRHYLDIWIGENPCFSITADTTDLIHTSRIKGSPENTRFLKFQQKLFSINQQKQHIFNLLENNIENKYKYTSQLTKLDRRIQTNALHIIHKYPASTLANFIRLTLPVFLTSEQNAKVHYWDYTDFQDSTLIHTPIFKNKLDEFFNSLVPMNADSVYAASVKLIEQARGCKPMFRYLVNYCFNHVITHLSVVDMDAAFVRLARRYYLSGQADWVDPILLKAIEHEVILSQNNLIGQLAQELKLPTLEGNWVSLYEIDAPFTLLLFWEVNCNYCEQEVPLVKTKLLDQFKEYGLKVFAVYTQDNPQEWENFVIEHELYDFINCWDPEDQSNFRVYYHVNSTPIIYLLDQDKRIIAKRLELEQFEEILRQAFEQP